MKDAKLRFSFSERRKPHSRPFSLALRGLHAFEVKVEGTASPGAEKELGHMEVWSREDVPERMEQNNLHGVPQDVQGQHFRTFCYEEEEEGPRAICSHLHRLCRRWLKPERHTKSEMLDLVVLEQFLTVLPAAMGSWVRECRPDTTAQAVALAEGFLLSQAADKKQEEEAVGKQRPSELSRGFPQAVDAPWHLRQHPPAQKTQDKRGGTALPICRNVLGTGRPLPQLCGEAERVSVQPEEGAVGFEDLVVRFTEQEWALLDLSQRALHRDVMEETWAHTVSLAPGGREKETEEGLHEVSLEDLPDKETQQRRGTGTSQDRRRDSSLPPSRTFQGILVEGTDNNNGQQECSVCRETLSVHTGLKAHWETHSGRKRKLRELLEHDEDFCNNPSLGRERRIHSGEKAYTCLECGKSFRDQNNLKVHSAFHTSFHAREKPFKCLECGKCFWTTNTLRLHQGVHTRKKTFKCLECGKSFTDGEFLVNHMRIHTGEKPYKCLGCGESFRHGASLRTHYRLHMKGSLKE